MTMLMEISLSGRASRARSLDHAIERSSKRSAVIVRAISEHRRDLKKAGRSDWLFANRAD
jgi:hypothetical protein